MATVCTHCGAKLPRDDVRFCNNCGAPISDHSSRSDARLAAGEDRPGKVNDALDASSLPEQVARQPAAPSTHATNSKKADPSNVTPWLGIQGQDATNVTPWLGIQGQDATNVTPWLGIQGYDDTPAPAQNSSRPAPDKPADTDGSSEGNANTRRPGLGLRLGRNRGTADRPPANFSWPEPMTHIVTGRDQPTDAEAVPQDAFPVLPSTPPPARELHTKVWDDIEETPTVIEMPAPEAEPVPDFSAASQTQETEIEDLPTRSLSSVDLEADDPAETTLTHLPTTPLSSIAPSAQPAEVRPLQQAEAVPAQEPELNRHIDQLATAQWQTPDLAHEQAPSSPASASGARGISTPGLDAYTSVPERPRQEAQVTTSAAEPLQQERQAQRSAFVQARPESAQQAKRKRRSPLVAIVAAVLIIVLALSAWLIVSHSSTVLQDTKPMQSVTDNSLGLSMEYPTGWQSNPNGTTLKLIDSSNTAQITIARADSSTTDPAKYLQQQATKLGMTDAKTGGAATFAGTSWQQISGDFQLSGASYIGTIYVSMHNNQLYTWTQMAPKNVAQDEEKLVFAPARSSLQFH